MGEDGAGDVLSYQAGGAEDKDVLGLGCHSDWDELEFVMPGTYCAYQKLIGEYRTGYIDKERRGREDAPVMSKSIAARTTIAKSGKTNWCLRDMSTCVYFLRTSLSFA